MDDKEDCNYFPLQVKATAVFFTHFTSSLSQTGALQNFGILGI